MNEGYRWLVYALLGAFFAGVVQVASKPAVERLGDASVNLIRAGVMVGFFVAVIAYEVLVAKTRAGVTMKDGGTEDATIHVRAAVALAVGSGVAASLSWFFGYKALRLSMVSKSYPIDKLSVVFGIVLAIIFLGERPGAVNYLGIALMIGGAYLVTLKAT